MAIDPSIPLQAKAPQRPDLLEQYGRMQSIKADQLVLQEGQRKVQTQNAFRNALASGADLNDPEVVNRLMAIDPTATMALREGTTKIQQTQHATQEGAIKNARAGLDFVNTPQAGAQWLTAQFNDPVMGKYFAAMGKTREQSLAEYRQMVTQPGGFEKWRQQAAMGTDKMRQHLIAERGQDNKFNIANLDRASRERIAAANRAVTEQRQGASATGGDQVSGAQKQMAQGVARLRGILDELNERKALRGGKASGTFSGDFMAGVGASGVGQAFQGAFSTEAQKLRDEYEAISMSLLPAYMKAQGMGSKTMDAVEERRMMQKAFGSPELTYEANIRMLNLLEGDTGWTGSVGQSQRPSDKATVDFNSLK